MWRCRSHSRHWGIRHAAGSACNTFGIRRLAERQREGLPLRTTRFAPLRLTIERWVKDRDRCQAGRQSQSTGSPTICLGRARRYAPMAMPLRIASSRSWFVQEYLSRVSFQLSKSRVWQAVSLPHSIDLLTIAPRIPRCIRDTRAYLYIMKRYKTVEHHYEISSFCPVANYMRWL